jgi:large subunit ribosomal protein L4
MKSVRNLADVHVLAVDQLNTYDVLCADDILFTRAAYETFTGLEVAVPAKADKPANKVETAPKADKPAKKVETAPKADKPAKAEKPAKADEPAAADLVDLPKGAVAALEDGSAPEGYTVKGNADSGLYHEPDGQWYEQTVAEVWFKTAKAAEKAGFTKAGSAKKSEDEK